MPDMLSNLLIGLIIAVIPLVLVGTVWLIRMISAQNIERRNVDRRLGLVEDEIKDLRKVLINLGKIDTMLEQINKVQNKISDKLDMLSDWQHLHEPIIKDAEIFIREARTNGIRAKE